MHNYLGQCTCGRVQVSINLPQALDNYHPAVCDCDFCTSRGIRYIAHPKGKLEILTKLDLTIDQHGSNQAQFISCPKCKTVIAATLTTSNKLLGTLNATLLTEFSKMGAPIDVSPKLLSPSEKRERWQARWLITSIN